VAVYVLVHGAWHGGWCWRRVARHLRSQGHEVYAPTLTGLSDRAHALTHETGLSTHIQDIVRFLDSWDLTEVHLVGHSYGGQVITGVSREAPSRLARIIYVDAFVAEAGESAIDLLPESVAGHFRDSVRDAGFGWLIPPRSLEVLGVTDPADLSWLRPRLTPQPWKSYLEPACVRADLPSSYIDCTDWMGVFAPFAERARNRGWDVQQIATGHEAMVTAPEELARLLLHDRAVLDPANAL
jgi:pimeloyl-ACP methyl ester carboxylesterase